MPSSDTPWFLGVVLVLWVALVFAAFEPPTEPEVPRFVTTGDGGLADATTAMVWRPGPDRAMSWKAAQEWLAGIVIDDSRWRMPTIGEVKSLRAGGMGATLLADAFQSSGYWAWALDDDGTPARWLYRFSYGGEGWNGAPPADGGRVFAVRRGAR